MKILTLLEYDFKPEISVKRKKSLFKDGERYTNIDNKVTLRRYEPEDPSNPKKKIYLDNKKKIEILGRGTDAGVLDTGKPGEVTKVSKPKVNTQQDGYNLFIKEIFNSREMQDNPYFPKIYKIKNNFDRYGKMSYKMNMEKLYPITDLSVEELDAILERITIANLIKYKKDQILQYRNSDFESTALQPKDLASIISDVIDSSLEGYLSIIKDRELKRALTLIINLRKKYPKMINDIKPANLMFRRTSVGAQLVVIDPVHIFHD